MKKMFFASFLPVLTAFVWPTLLSAQILLSPQDATVVQTNQLLFSWDGQDLEGADKTYHLSIKKVEEKQYPDEAMERNRAIFETEIINNESFNLDLSALKEETNGKYAWQLVVFSSAANKKRTEISRSPIRTFQINTQPEFSKLTSSAETGKEPKHSNNLAAPPTGCINGDLELGNLQGWNGYYGNRSNSATINLNSLTNGLINGRHTLRQSSDGFDPNIGGTILPQVASGNYSVRLGNSATGGDADVISYTFTVNQQNKNFSFKYALVLQNPSGHNQNEQPFFGYYVLKGSSIFFSSSNLPVAGKQVVSDASNPFFKTKGGLVYREWTPTCIDLSNYLGQTMTIVFYVADCSKGGHYGYAYLDDLCNSNEAIASFTMPNEICPSQNLLIDGTASVNETSYFWSIEESDASGGRPNPASEVYDWVVAQQAGIINYSALYQSKGRQFKCNTYYRIKLAVNNDCTPWNEQVKLLHVKCPVVNAGTDQCVSCTPTGALIQLGQGNSGAAGLTYSWTPGTGLNNANLPSPSHQEGSTPYPFTYTVIVTDNTGCTNSDQVTLYCKPSNVTLTQTKHCCGYTLTANAQNYDNISWSTGASGVTTINVTAGGTYSVTVSNTCGQVTQSITIPSGTLLTGFFNVIAYNSKFYPPYGGSGLSDKLYIKDVMSGNGAANVPNSYNATEYKLEIYNRWGSLIRTMTGQSCNGFNNWSINWDGRDQGGNLVQQDVYVWRLYFKNCQYTSWWQPKERRFVDRVCLDCGGFPGYGCGFWNHCKKWNVPAGTTEDVVITHGSVTVVR